MKMSTFIILLSILSVVNAYFLKDGEELDENFEKRFKLSRNRWSKTPVTYSVDEKRLTDDLTLEEIYSGLEEAFKIWADASDFLSFERIADYDSAAIKIYFGTLSHGDSYPFYGRGGTLAHAFYPTKGEVHFDDDETFYYNTKPENNANAVNFVYVAAHEIGHALGMKHSEYEDSLMYPYYRSGTNALNEDDIAGIREQYSTRGTCCKEMAEDGETCKTAFPELRSVGVCCATIGTNFFIDDEWKNCSDIYESECGSGYFNSPACQDIDECYYAYRKLCGGSRRDCINTIGSYQCKV